MILWKFNGNKPKSGGFVTGIIDADDAELVGRTRTKFGTVCGNPLVRDSYSGAFFL